MAKPLDLPVHGCLPLLLGMQGLNLSLPVDFFLSGFAPGGYVRAALSEKGCRPDHAED